MLEEALEDLDAEARPDAAQTRMVGEWLIERVAEILAIGQVQARRLDQAPL